jgi:glutamate-ammonia-ligase adenylyltransferase
LVDELLSEVPAREVLTELTPALLEAFAGSGDPDAALSAFDEALARMPASVQLLSILRSNSALRELFGDVLGSAPRLAQVIASPGARARRCDRSVGQPRLRHELRRRSVGARVETFVAQEQSFEDALNRARDFAAEETFHIGLNLLSGLYDFPAAASESDGRKRLGPSLYYVRLTQRLISALTAPTKARRLYEVDMRLRPSGRQGPLAIQFASFKLYQQDEAESWEHMALTRARFVAGDASLGAALAKTVRETTGERGAAAIAHATRAMRGLIAREKGDADVWDLKFVAGGLIDIEFVAQYLQLVFARHHPAILDVSTRKVVEEAGRRRDHARTGRDSCRHAPALYGRDAVHALVDRGPIRSRQSRREREAPHRRREGLSRF